MHNGVITVPMYQGDDIIGCLNTAILYAIINNNPLQEIFCAVKLTDKVRLVDTYHGQRMCVFGRLRCRQRDEAKENRGGRAGVRLVVSITPAVLSTAYRFLLVQFKTNKLCIGESLLI